MSSEKNDSKLEMVEKNLRKEISQSLKLAGIEDSGLENSIFDSITIVSNKIKNESDYYLRILKNKNPKPIVILPFKQHSKSQMIKSFRAEIDSILEAFLKQKLEKGENTSANKENKTKRSSSNEKDLEIHENRLRAIVNSNIVNSNLTLSIDQTNAAVNEILALIHDLATSPNEKKIAAQKKRIENLLFITKIVEPISVSA